MKLIYLLQRKSWFIESGDKWAVLEDSAAIDLAASVFHLQCVDEFALSEQPVINGRAEVIRLDENSVNLRVYSSADELLTDEKITLEASILSSIEWIDAPYGDGWIQSVARLSVENVRRLVLKAYLPPSDTSEYKQLLVCNETSGEEKPLQILRGQETELIILNEASPVDSKLLLKCDSEAANDSRDVRSLGFVLLDKVVDI
jgi:hypothetical protein